MPGRLSIKNGLAFLSGLILSVVFFWSGISKLLDPEGFALAVYRYHLLPGEWVNLAALWVPVLEICCAILVFVPKFRLSAIGILLLLLIIFSMIVVISILSGNTMACGCFSTSVTAGSMGWAGLLKNFGLIVLGIMGVNRELKS